MITLAELDKSVTKFIMDDLKDYPNSLEIELQEWNRIFGVLSNESFVDEFGENCFPYVETTDDILAYFLWKNGCNCAYVISYWGNESWTISLPTSEKECQENISEGTAYWEEVIEE